MKVNVSGHGVINFPDSMSDKEVRAVLRQFEPKQDDTLPKLLETFQKLLTQKPKIVTEKQVVEVEKQVVVKVPEVKMIEVEKVVEVVGEPISWNFTVERDEDGITNVIAEPING